MYNLVQFGIIVKNSTAYICKHSACLHTQKCVQSIYQCCNTNYPKKSTLNKLNISVIWNISKFSNATNNFWSLVMTGLADVDGFKLFIQASVWLGFPPQKLYFFKYRWYPSTLRQMPSCLDSSSCKSGGMKVIPFTMNFTLQSYHWNVCLWVKNCSRSIQTAAVKPLKLTASICINFESNIDWRKESTLRIWWKGWIRTGHRAIFKYDDII